MAYPTEVAAVVVAPAGNLGTSTPTHRQLHDQYRTALLSIQGKIDGPTITPTVVTSSGTGAVTFDCSAGTIFDRTMTGNTSITLSNPTAGVPITVVLRQNATGGFTVTWTTTVKWMGQDPIWSGVLSKISGTATLMFLAGAWVGWWGGGEQ